MDNNLFPAGMSEKEIKDNLQAMAYSIEETTYNRPLNPDEIDSRKDLLIKNIFKNSELEAKKKSFIAQIKSEQKLITEESNILRSEIKTGQETKTGVLYYVDDQDSKVMNVYDETGTFIFWRKLRSEEKQPSIFKIVSK